MLERKDLLFPELSYQILGCAFEVYNKIGPGHLEKVYQRAMASTLASRNLKFKEQSPIALTLNGERISNGYADFFVEESVLIELKRGRFSLPKEIEQTQEYLKSKNIQLAIVIRFTSDGVRYKRVLNIPGYQKSA